jgi:hypothetical protein
MSLAPTNEESAWSLWGKTFIGKKSLNWVLVMWQVWLVWILTTKRKSLKRVENFERYVIFSCYYLLILLIKWLLFCCVHLLFRFILQAVLLSGYLSFQFVPHWTLIVCSFIFEWRNLLFLYEMMPRFCLVECTFVSIQFLCVIIPFDLHLAVMVKILSRSSCLCSPVIVQSAMRQDVSVYF